MEQRRWLELVSDYDCEFHTFAISVEKMSRPLQVDMCNLGMEVIIGKLSALTIQPTIMEAIKGGQLTGPLIEKFKQKAL